MKNLAYKLFACAFNLFRHLPMREEAVLLSPHMAAFTDSLGECEAQLQRRGIRTGRICGSDIRPRTLSPSALWRMIRFFTKGAHDLARAKLVFLNDNFMPLADLNVRPQAVWVQLWHAEGAFKRFGLDIADLPQAVRTRVENGNRKLSFVVCSSESVVPIYASAFGVPQQKVLPLGSPRADRYMRNLASFDIQGFREKWFGGTDKKAVLYAPTFRDDPTQNRALLSVFDFERFRRELGSEYLLVLRLHPQFHDVPVPQGVLNMTDYPNAGDLIAACDLLVTDYSSICMDFALCRKPCVFFAFDLADYTAARSFYREYKSYVPGAVAETMEALIPLIRTAEAHTDAADSFVRFNFGTPDGRSAERVVDAAMHAANLQ